MTKQRTTLTSIAAIAGAGTLFLGLHACGQKPAPAEEAAATSAATTSGLQAMRVIRIESRSLAEEIDAKGRLVVREEAAVGTELPGYRVAAVFADEGDWVKQGQAMARLDDALLQAQIAQAEASLKTQEAAFEFQKNQLARAEALVAEGAFSRVQLEQTRLETTSSEAQLAVSRAALNEMKVRQARMTMRAPVSGMVLQRSIRPGEISGGAAGPYFRISRDGLIELDAELSDSKLSMVKVGERVDVTLPSGRTIAGKIRFVSPRVDVASGLGRARVELPFDKELRPGGFAQARFNGAATGALSVLASAIRYESGGPALMVVDDANKVSRVPVKLGERMGDYVQLLESPPAGTRVLETGSAFTLDGDVINPVEEAAAPAPATSEGN